MTDTLTAAQFQDTKGRVWDLTLNLTTARRVTASDFTLVSDTPVNLLKVPDEGLLMELMINRGLALAVCWAIICDIPQAAEAASLSTQNDCKSEDDFGLGITGPVAEAATEALMGAFSDFFPTLRTSLLRCRTMYHQVLERQEMKIQKKAPEMVDALDQMMDREMDKLLEEATKGGGKTGEK